MPVVAQAWQGRRIALNSRLLGYRARSIGEEERKGRKKRKGKRRGGRQGKRKGEEGRGRNQREKREGKKEHGPYGLWSPSLKPPSLLFTDSASQRNKQLKQGSQLTPQPFAIILQIQMLQVEAWAICSANHPKSSLQKESRIQSTGGKN